MEVGEVGDECGLGEVVRGGKVLEVEGGGEGLYELGMLVGSEGRREMVGREERRTSSSISKRVKPAYLGSSVVVGGEEMVGGAGGADGRSRGTSSMVMSVSWMERSWEAMVRL